MGVKTHTSGKRAVRIADGVVNTVVLVVLIALAAVSLYALWDSHAVNAQASSEKYAIYAPTKEASSLSFAQMQKINPETQAWLNVYGTGIDYPITQAADNQKYLNTDALGNYSLSGSLYLDYRNANDFSDFTSIVYGHHMVNHLMFGDVGNFSAQSYFDGHAYGDLYFGGTHHGVEIFAFAHTDGYNAAVYEPGITSPEAKQKYLNYLTSISQHTRDVGVTTRDHIIVLSTCNSDSTNGRDILVARITDNTFANTLESASQKPHGIMAFVDVLPSLWKKFPHGVLLIGLPLLIALLGTILLRDKKRRTKAEFAATATTALSDAPSTALIYHTSGRGQEYYG